MFFNSQHFQISKQLVDLVVVLKLHCKLKHFWHIFEKKKLHDYKLDNTPKAIFGTYQIGGQYAEIKARIRIGNEAYNAHQT